LDGLWEKTGICDYNNPELKKKWDADGTYHDMDFLSAATAFLQQPIREALSSDNGIIRIFAIVDRRVGKRTLQKIRAAGVDQGLPGWVRQFYELRYRMTTPLFSHTENVL